MLGQRAERAPKSKIRCNNVAWCVNFGSFWLPFGLFFGHFGGKMDQTWPTCSLVDPNGVPGAPNGLPWVAFGPSRGSPGEPLGGAGGAFGGHGVDLLDTFGAKSGTKTRSFWCIFVIFARLCFGCGFRHGFVTHFGQKHKSPSYVKNVDLVIHMVKHIWIDRFCRVMSCLVLSCRLVLCCVTKMCPTSVRKVTKICDK